MSTQFGFEALGGGGSGSGLHYLGTWDAATNTPTITSGVGTPGDYYIVSVAGTTTIDGISDWQVGDWIIFSDTGVWQKIDNSDAGVVVADTGTGSSVRINNGNCASGSYSTALGYNNTASATYSTVGGGNANTASNYHSTVSGGYQNTASASYSTVSGGRGNTASASYSTVSGGYCNVSCGIGSIVSAGQFNTSSGYGSFIGNGLNNTSSSTASFIGNGSNQVASGCQSVVVGGAQNSATCDCAFIGNGSLNTASDYSATVINGCLNTASGAGSTVINGVCNVASSSFSTASGVQANTFVSDFRQTCSSGAFATSGDLQKSTFILKASSNGLSTRKLTTDFSGVYNAKNHIILQNNNTFGFTGTIVAKQQGSSNSAMWKVEGLITRGANAASTTLTFSSVTVVSNAPGWTNPVLSTDLTQGGLDITVNASGVNSLWSAYIETTEVIYA